MFTEATRLQFILIYSTIVSVAYHLSGAPLGVAAPRTCN